MVYRSGATSLHVITHLTLVEIRAPLLPRVCEESDLPFFNVVVLDVIEANEESVVGEIVVEGLSFVTTACEYRIEDKDRDARDHEHRMHESP